jgi:hypothetical protein
VYNIKKAVSRLDFAPKMDDIKVTDIKKGLGTFVPKSDKPVSFAALKTTLKKAGYTLASAEITVIGTLRRDNAGWWVEVEPSKQRFAITGKDVSAELGGADVGDHIEITGNWQSEVSAGSGREVVTLGSARKLVAGPKPRAAGGSLAGTQVSLTGIAALPGLFLAPIRTTSPGLTVYKGGAIAPEYTFTRQHLGGLKVERHTVQLNLSYTPTPTLQLEADVPYSETSFSNGLVAGSGHGLGNITLWGKYRFFRTLETWGDRQAAVRIGLELPTGKSDAPTEVKLPVDGFVRQQLTPISGGLSLHTDATYSQAKGRFIYGANIEGTLRGQRDGYRVGHEVQINTDFEYVLLPFKYRSPTKEMFTILETTFIHRGQGYVEGVKAPGSRATEFYIEPGLQYVATPRLAIEASYQFPLIRNTGPLVLRTDQNVLVRLKYLY